MKKTFLLKIIVFGLALFVGLLVIGMCRASYSITVENQNKQIKFYIPEVKVQTEEWKAKQYFLLSMAYEPLYSFNHLRFDHWWTGIMGIYIVVEEEKIVEELFCFEDNSLNKQCYVPSDFSVDYDGEFLHHLLLVSDSVKGKIQININKVSLTEALVSENLIEEFQVLKRKVEDTEGTTEMNPEVSK
jgi:hypothetical protein